MSGFIFLIVIDWIMKNVTERNNTWIRWKFMEKLEDLDFADDIALLSSNFQHMQTKVSKLNNYARKTGLKINSKKTEVLRINSKSNSNITIAGQQLNEVDKYMGAIISNQGGGGEDINSRIRKAMGSFMKLKQIWNSNKLTLRTKLRLFQALVRSVLFYGCETWKINDSDNKKLDTFQFKCLRRILNVRWPYIISNNDILRITKIKTISDEVKERRWKWIGHVLRKDDNCHCMTLALTWAPEGRRKVGRPKTTWRRTVEKERNALGWKSWGVAKPIARDRVHWRRNLAALWATGPEEDR